MSPTCAGLSQQWSYDAPRARYRALLLLGVKAGDNAQVQNLAAALDAETEIVPLEFNSLHVLPNFIAPAGLLSLTPAARRTLTGCTEPDLIISAGKRSYRAARHLKARWGSAVRWIHIGRPWGPLATIDLILTTPQYRLPAAANVITLPYPITTLVVDDKSVPPQRQVGEWIVLVGGNSSSNRFDRKTVNALRNTIETLAIQKGVRLTVLSSRRTPAVVIRMLTRLDVDTCRWIAPPTNISSKPSDSYSQLLARADALVVTGDSASMIGDALDTNRPVMIVPVSERFSARFLDFLGRIIGYDEKRPGRAVCRAVEHGLLTLPRRMQKLDEALMPYRDNGVRDVFTQSTGAIVLRRGARPPSWKTARDAVERLLELPRNIRTSLLRKPDAIPNTLDFQVPATAHEGNERRTR